MDEEFNTFVESFYKMSRLLLVLVCCFLSMSAFPQAALNKTDASGMKQGRWEAKYPGGTKKYEGTFLNNKPVGEWKRFHENGKTKALMTYRSQSESVYAILFDEEGKRYAEGVFVGTFRDSIWVFYNGDLVVRLENYRNGKKEGKSTGFDSQGKKTWEKNWKSDLQDGVSMDYYPNGQKRNEITFVSGKKNGPARFYNESGEVSMEGSYVDDLSEGKWNIYSTNGVLKYQLTYEKGEIRNGGAMDSLQLKEFKRYDQLKGKIPEPKLNESGMP